MPWLANRVPPGVELGFHICSIWHHDPAAGQDNRALVDIANAIMARVDRPIAYLHIPIIPEHVEADFLPLADLRLPPETELYLSRKGRAGDKYLDTLVLSDMRAAVAASLAQVR